LGRKNGGREREKSRGKVQSPGERGHLRFDLHIHSSCSDGRDGVEAILEAAIEKDLDGIAITDHDTLEGTFQAEAIVRDKKIDLLVIPGVEVSTSDGHLLALGMRELPPKGRSPEETIEFVHHRGGIAIVSHPYHLFRHAMFRIPPCDAVEVYNSKYIFGIANWWAKRGQRVLAFPWWREATLTWRRLWASGSPSSRRRAIERKDATSPQSSMRSGPDGSK
jgi:predicted metal-dependent phosphoesterase TrpH